MSSLKLQLTFPSVSLNPQPTLGALDAGNGEEAQRSHPTLTLLLVTSAALLFVIAVLIVTLSIIVLTRLSGHLSEFLLTLYLNTIIYSLLALSSSIAVYIFFPRSRGRTALKAKWLHFFSSAYASLFVLSLGVSVIFVYLLFQWNSLAVLPDTRSTMSTLDRTSAASLGSEVGKCVPDSRTKAHGKVLMNLCMQSTPVRVWGVTLIVIGWLVNIVVITLVGQYARHMRSQSRLKLGFATTRLKKHGYI